ncbi:RNA polymerase sigma factor [Neorhodopirellula pilleata]|uniref:ECF RNA polymerase sigma factor SigW n=1 Tax=Neorhodopirellula pilleata TaxID=2714738 RepID=A0A5C6AYJ6_9BACT|nr:sigma-70 family RNA polymerase sigma factor [Neorhodopirellula pilleata]TWU04056.1 ECF RNA polymerase sigma factor SigW [Neorhodopirellula pilleata]
MSDDWKTIVREQGTGVYRIAWRILGNADDADETVQDVFLQAHQYKSQNDVDNVVGLLKRLAVCRSLDRLRRRRAEVCLDDVTVFDRESGPEDQAVGKELESMLRDAVGQLPGREAEVFCLRYFDELTNQQIADALNMTTAAVATAIYKARTKLAATLADLNEGVS